MRGYGQYCPIALAAEVFAERWTPIIIRNLSMGCSRYGEILDGAPGLPRSVLSQRLRGLERAGVVERTATGRATAYALTPSGSELADVCVTLGGWGARWREALPEDQDPYLALWTVARLVPAASLPRHRVVVRFHVTDRTEPSSYWLVLSASDSEVCVRPPGYAEDGVVATDTATLVRWYAGQVSLAAAVRAGTATVMAPPWLVRELARWGRLSPYAGVPRATPPPAPAAPDAEHPTSTVPQCAPTT